MMNGSLHGEVCIVLYQSRLNGGNSLLGEVNFDLSDVAISGSNLNYLNEKEDMDGKVVSGSFPLMSRSGEEVGEVDVCLHIVWRGLGVNVVNEEEEEEKMTKKTIVTGGTKMKSNNNNNNNNRYNNSTITIIITTNYLL